MTREGSDTYPIIRTAVPIMIAWMLLTSAFLFSVSTKAEEITYPNEYTHRPMLEWFTGLGCGACINNAYPAMEEVMGAADATDGVPFNLVVFHQNLSGGQRDDLTTAESQARFDYYKDDFQEDIPNMIFDGGFDEINPSDPEAIRGDINASGKRELKKATLWVQAEVKGEKLEFDVKAHNIGDSDISGSLYVFVIENGVIAYSSVKDENLTNDHVFRGYGLKGKTATISAGGWFNTSGEWGIPDNATVPVDPEGLSVVAALYDTRDVVSANIHFPPDPEPNQNYKKPTPRCIQTATPETTEYDGGFPVTPSDITISSVEHTPEEPVEGDIVNISAEVVSARELRAVTLSYEHGGESYGPISMSSSGNNYWAEIGPFPADTVVSYYITAEDDKAAEEISPTVSFEVKGKNGGDVPDGSLEINNVRLDPENPGPADRIKIYAAITSRHDITSAKVYYWEEGEEPESKVLREKSGEYFATLGIYPSGTVLHYNVSAFDADGNHEETVEASVTIEKEGDGSDEPEDENGTVPGFEASVLLSALLIVTIIIHRRRENS